MKLTDIENHLRQFRIGIAGAGGIGSNCAMALARCGVGELVIADNDYVEESNLSRQYYFTDQTGMSKCKAIKNNLERANNKVSVTTCHIQLDKKNIPDIFAGCNAIVEALDRPEMKEMLIEAVQTRMPGIPVVVCSGMSGWGNNELIKCRKIDDTLFICGDELTEADEDLPPMAPRVGIVANMQANVVVEILMKLKR